MRFTINETIKTEFMNFIQNDHCLRDTLHKAQILRSITDHQPINFLIKNYIYKTARS